MATPWARRELRRTMSLKGLLCLLVVGLCASQIVSANREARAIAVSDLMATAQAKLKGMVKSVKDAAVSSVDTVWGYIDKLELCALDYGTSYLNKRGIDVNLTEIALLVRENAKLCAQDEEIRKDARLIIGDVATCISGDVDKLKGLVGDMQQMWQNAKSLPSSVQDVAKKCIEHGESDDSAAGHLDITALVSSDAHELTEHSNRILTAASHHLSKRDLWSVGRALSCAKSVFNFAQKDLIAIPAAMVATAGSAYTSVNTAQGRVPACAAQKVAANSGNISKLALKAGSCVASGAVLSEENIDALAEQYPALAAIKRLAAAAEKLSNLQKIVDSHPVLKQAKALAS